MFKTRDLAFSCGVSLGGFGLSRRFLDCPWNFRLRCSRSAREFRQAECAAPVGDVGNSPFTVSA